MYSEYKFGFRKTPSSLKPGPKTFSPKKQFSPEKI
jgi:hypothetical protein